ncbi:hypothetical protein [Flammeovirga sp. OC4]|uniref:hypothetical protein n=1 Tax=Flammeovirga sp. OC4 TaxID=1382345 RepID=UPI0005C6B91C|nr:hypothetical protein [Flammeovirga sp. OC4]
MKQNPIVRVYARLKKYAVVMFALVFIFIVFGNVVKAQNSIPDYRTQGYIKCYPAINKVETEIN